MNVTELKDKVLKKLDETDLQYDSRFNRKEEILRIERHDNHKGVDVQLNKLLQKATKSEEIIDEIVYYVSETLTRMADTKEVTNEGMIYPVVRSTSFPKEAKDGKKFIFDEHTAETVIFYALDHGRSYELIDESLLETLGLTKEALKEKAFNNLKTLDIKYKKETVQENDFYFISHRDGYDASRILNEEFLNDFHSKLEGEMMIGLPHQDVLIIVDVKNEVGYDIMAQMMMQYFAEGLTPITSLSFSYRHKKLEPVFILGKAKNYNKNKK
uniref:DUF1444 family protein n=1 Tax=Nosocomiicoccus ampullae TaxID=489910 RepID=UPI00083438BB|nr:DUF1444 family protein [Nosocomiicoccus ampullae]